MLHRRIVRSLILVCLMLLVVLTGVTNAQIPLPESDWYAVAWVQDTDRLHWINSAGEQADIQRPALEDQASLQNTRLTMSPNGRYLAVISPLTTGVEAIGFYDLQTGEWLQVHTAESGEVFGSVSYEHSLITSEQIAVSLSGPNGWRIIVFEWATGDALTQLTSDDPGLPPITAGYDVPIVLHFDIDEGMGQTRVRFQMTPAFPNGENSFPSFMWYPFPVPAVGDPIKPDALGFSTLTGMDIINVTGQVAFSWLDPDVSNPALPTSTNSIQTQAAPDQAPQTVAADAGAILRFPRWLNGSEWIAHYHEDKAFAPHWVLSTADGQNPVPIGPNFINVYGTPDGYLAYESDAGRLSHDTVLPAEGFTMSVGNVVFNPGVPFGIVHVTPMGATFNLPSLGGVQTTVDGPNELAPPPAGCPDAPAPRMVIGEQGRVTFTDGAALNLRLEPAGELIGSLPEGTVFDVVAGPECADGYLWWQIEKGAQAWVAEGDADDYYIEPYDGIELIDPPQFVPTSTPLQVAPPVIEPTATQSLQVAPPVIQPTATPMQIAPPVIQPTATQGLQVAPPQAASCHQSPPSQLQQNMLVHTTISGGTLGMYSQHNSPTPFRQIGNNIAFNVIGGPLCNANGVRMWQLSGLVDGAQTVGWVGEGFGSKYYLQPGPARAN